MTLVSVFDLQLSDFDRKKIETVVNVILFRYDPEEIYLFGSYAKGMQNQYSDIDIIVIKETNEPLVRRGLEVKRQLFSELEDYDLFFYTRQEYEMKRNKIATFENRIQNSKKLIYRKNNY